LATAVSAFLFEGWTRGEHLLVIVKPQNWKGIRARFERRGCDVARAMADERLTLLDAHDTLARIMQGTMPDERAFCEIVEPRLHRASEGRPVRVFGELVELLAEEQNYSAARELETCWNDFTRRKSLALLCGYSSAHFVDSSRVDTLQAFCALHTRVQRSASDVMGAWLHRRWQDAERARRASRLEPE